MELIFALQRTLGDESYWELRDQEDDPLVKRVRKGEVQECGCLMMMGHLPAAWSPGRFFMLLRTEGEKEDWREVSHLAGAAFKLDPEAGLEVCPDWLRSKYEALVDAENR